MWMCGFTSPPTFLRLAFLMGRFFNTSSLATENVPAWWRTTFYRLKHHHCPQSWYRCGPAGAFLSIRSDSPPLPPPPDPSSCLWALYQRSSSPSHLLCDTKSRRTVSRTTISYKHRYINISSKYRCLNISHLNTSSAARTGHPEGRDISRKTCIKAILTIRLYIDWTQTCRVLLCCSNIFFNKSK